MPLVNALEPGYGERTLPIEEVTLGQRVLAVNPSQNGSYESTQQSDCRDWEVVRLEVQHRNGSIVDVHLLRSGCWIDRNGLRVGATIELGLTDLDVDASAHVVSISDAPEIDPGPGAVVTGRFVTRQGSGLVRVTFEDGTVLVGTKNHPVWSPSDRNWLGLGKFKAGQFVQARAGLLAIVSVEELCNRPRLYNIEVAGEHVYEVTPAGILVHNNNPICKELAELREKASKNILTPDEAKQLAKLEAEAKTLAPCRMRSISRARLFGGSMNDRCSPKCIVI